MQRLQAFKFELMPNGQQMRKMSQFAGMCRFVFNQALALQKENHEAGNKFLNYAALTKHLTVWRNSPETAWLSQGPSQAQQQTLKDLEKAYKNFFEKRAAFPQFKRKGDNCSFRFPDPKQFKLDEPNARIFLPKLGWIRYRKSRNILGELRNITVLLRAGKWYFSVQTQREVQATVPLGTQAIGLDVGIASFATDSGGKHIEALHSFKRHEARLRRYQKSMSRKCKGSKNWKKSKARLQRMHARIANVRQDFLHKTSSEICSINAMVVVEDLRIKNMSKSARGNAQAPGKNVKAKSGLNKSILDQGWGEFHRQLEYKMQWSGGIFVAVDPKNTSRECPRCGHIHADNRKTQAVFCCVACDHTAHADHVGAINILARGHRVLACGENVSRAKPAKARCAISKKQEPAEAINGALNALH